MMDKTKKQICKHCGEPIAIRNPSGYCDHLYYPENCEICKKMLTVERKIYEWEVSDEYGWRNIELWEVDKKLELFAFDKDGGEVEPRV